MSLADFQPERATIKLKRTSFQVEGLSLESIATLVRTHLPDLDAIFDLFQQGDGLKAEDLAPVLTSIITQAPGLSANIIALASGETDATANAAKLPVGVQLEALTKIVQLTFDEVGGVKKAWETLTGLLKLSEGTKLKEALTKRKAR